MVESLLFKNFQEYSPIIEIESKTLIKMGVRLFIKMEYLIHNKLSGNKYRKLKYNLIEANQEKKSCLLTFGGAYSNHIAAVAQAGHLFNLDTIGIIRGEEPKNPSYTLREARQLGMKLVFVSRSAYRDKEKLLSDLQIDLTNIYLFPEGGTNDLALKGAAEIVKHTESEVTMDYWCAACGTGGTAAGIISALTDKQQFLGFSVLKGDFMTESISQLLKGIECNKKNWLVNNDYHFGGYAKHNDRLINFINDFKNKYQVPLDPIYTGKLLYGVIDLIGKGYFPDASNVMVVHSGGLQGIIGFNERNGSIIK